MHYLHQTAMFVWGFEDSVSFSSWASQDFAMSPRPPTQGVPSAPCSLVWGHRCAASHPASKCASAMDVPYITSSAQTAGILAFFLLLWQWKGGRVCLGWQFKGTVHHGGESNSFRQRLTLHSQPGHRGRRVSILSPFSPFDAAWTTATHIYSRPFPPTWTLKNSLTRVPLGFIS